MKNIITLISIFLITLVTAQRKPNAVIKNDAYTAYVDTTINMPIYVQYHLYNGGGSCERSNKWINDSKYKMIADSTYAGSNYEKGHLANAEDFAYDCHLDSLTFNTYNRLPQTRALNRGVWKTYEKEVRELSKKDSLIIYCGGYWDPLSDKKIKGMLIPTLYWKAVYDLNLGAISSIYIFTNSDRPLKYEVSIENLEIMLGYKLNIPVQKKKKKKK